MPHKASLGELLFLMMRFANYRGLLADVFDSVADPAFVPLKLKMGDYHLQIDC